MKRRVVKDWHCGCHEEYVLSPLGHTLAVEGSILVWYCEGHCPAPEDEDAHGILYLPPYQEEWLRALGGGRPADSVSEEVFSVAHWPDATWRGT